MQTFGETNWEIMEFKFAILGTKEYVNNKRLRAFLWRGSGTDYYFQLSTRSHEIDTDEGKVQFLCTEYFVAKMFLGLISTELNLMGFVIFVIDMTECVDKQMEKMQLVINSLELSSSKLPRMLIACSLKEQCDFGVLDKFIELNKFKKTIKYQISRECHTENLLRAVYDVIKSETYDQTKTSQFQLSSISFEWEELIALKTGTQ